MEHEGSMGGQRGRLRRGLNEGFEHEIQVHEGIEIWMPSVAKAHDASSMKEHSAFHPLQRGCAPSLLSSDA